MKKSAVLLVSVLVLTFLVSMAVMPASAKALQVNIYEWSSWEEQGAKVGKVIFGNPTSRSSKSAVDWMVTVVLQNGEPDHVYLVYIEINYHWWGWRYMALGLLTTDADGCGSFHYNGQFDAGVTATWPWQPPWGITGPGTYVLGICLNDVTGVEMPDGYENGAGIWWNVGNSVYTTWGDWGCLRSPITLD